MTALSRPPCEVLTVMLQDSAAAQGRRVKNKRLRVTRGPGESRDNKFSSREVEFLGFFPLSPSFLRQRLNHETSSRSHRETRSFTQPQDTTYDAIAFPATAADDLQKPRVNKPCLPQNGDNKPKMAKRRGPATRRAINGGLGSPSGSKGAMWHNEWGMDGVMEQIWFGFKFF